MAKNKNMKKNETEFSEEVTATKKQSTQNSAGEGATATSKQNR
jgi:hypothetical protein